MIVAESQRGRRIVGRLDRGVELLDGIAEVCRARNVRAGSVTALGSLEEVELGNLDAAGRALPPRRFASTFTVVHLHGSLGERDGKLHLEAACALSRERDNGVELVGGRLARARVHAIDFVIESFDDLLLRRSIDPSGLAVLVDAIAIPAPAPTPSAAPAAPAGAATPNGRSPSGSAGPDGAAPPHAADFEKRGSGHVVPRASEPAPPREPAPASPVPGPSWAEVAQTSASQPPVDEELNPGEREPLRAGDVLVHPSFGPCDVERIEGDLEFAHVRLKRDKRLVRLSLEIFQLRRDGADERGRRRFRAVVSRG